mmetsp:Transcript_54332/g.131869  ORF Transcript_54332/g.131869 Transcript_54332/m.131869 type:complete len:270 (+) Transcript_54332:122-931(+)|eukprot:CAMPEP_0113463024 /NCGR_PEP_ID=MMETSP0014_2-20120614/12420_1 /TAXON_ID=2857 /ORGANISM="Nitzschia sp." /LENGTH=269 /DNA_ID=CAMNT_0000354957 /DNA_START=89 /DNA_END=898 /DNA_ORIENTATION=+ /assembly_acc=CAM_ASM_000159
MITKQITVAAAAAAALFSVELSISGVAVVNAQNDTDANDVDVDVGIGGVSDITVVSIGDTYCVEGYVMDSYCIDIGSLLDKPNIRTLEGPDQHSIHCLVDFGPCLNSEFEILTPPLPSTAGSIVRYERSWRVTDLDGSKTVLVDLARNIGSCGTCEGGYNNGGQRSGFKAVMDATIVGFRSGETPPIISVTQAYDSTQFESSTEACAQYFPDLELGTTITGDPETEATTDGGNNTTDTTPPSSAPSLQVRMGSGFVTTTIVILLSIVLF